MNRIRLKCQDAADGIWNPVDVDKWLTIIQVPEERA